MVDLEKTAKLAGHLLADRALSMFHFANMVPVNFQSLGDLFLSHLILIATSDEHESRFGMHFNVFWATLRQGVVLRVERRSLTLGLLLMGCVFVCADIINLHNSNFFILNRPAHQIGWFPSFYVAGIDLLVLTFYRPAKVLPFSLNGAFEFNLFYPPPGLTGGNSSTFSEPGE